jgi:hypothetical protein
MMFIAALLALIAQASETPSPQCTAANSVQTTIAEIQSHANRFINRCVQVSGLIAGRTIYSGRDGIYLVSRSRAANNQARASFEHRLGIDSQQLGLPPGQPSWATVTGWVDSCEQRAARRQRARETRLDSLIGTLGGYCHWEAGLVLVPRDHAVREVRVERLTGESARQRFGNLVRMPTDWPQRTAVEEFAADFVASLHTRDRSRMAELHDIRPTTRHQGDRAMLDMLLSEAESPFAGIRAGDAPQTAIFVRREHDGSLRDRDAPSAVICFCRSADCTNRWPISDVDAGNSPERPYACTRVEPRDWMRRGAGLSTAPSRRGFLAEPMETAFRR